MSERKNKGFIWGEGILDFLAIEHYRNSIKARSMYYEDLYYHRVFHSTSYAGGILKELDQKLVRNRVTTYIKPEYLKSDNHPNAALINANELSAIGMKSFVPRVVTEANFADIQEEKPPDRRLQVTFMVKELIKKCNIPEKKVLAYSILKSGVSFDVDKSDLSEEFLSYLGSLEKTRLGIFDLIELVGSKAKTYRAKESIKTLILSEYPELFLKRSSKK